MVDYINVTNDNDSEFSDLLHNINYDNSIILSSHTNEPIIVFDDSNKISFITTHSLPFTNYTTINEFTLLDYVPKIKICHPLGVNLNFIEPYDMPFYNKIYPVNDLTFNSTCVLYNKIRTIIYLDRAIFRHLKKSLSISKNQKILTLDFSYNINATETIETIYHIQDSYVYNDFLKHFDQNE